MNHYRGNIRKWYNLGPIFMEFLILLLASFNTKVVWFLPKSVGYKIADIRDMFFLPKADMLKVLLFKHSGDGTDYINQSYSAFSKIFLVCILLVVIINMLRNFGFFHKLSKLIHNSNRIFLDVFIVSINSFLLSGLECNGSVFSVNSTAYMSAYPNIRYTFIHAHIHTYIHTCIHTSYIHTYI